MAKFPLDGKVAVVTGAETGLGAVVAAELARRGATLVVQYHASFAAAKQLVRDVERDGGQAIAVKADLKDPAQAEMLCMKASGALGKVDVMVVNTTETAEEPLIGTPDEATETLRKHLLSCLSPAYAALPGMIERGSGSLIYLTNGSDRELSHSAVGAALPHLAAEAGASNVRVNAVVSRMALPAEVKDDAAPSEDATPLRTPGSQDVANAVVMLASDDLDHVSGVALTIGDGAHIA